jgi:hypothetical protein
LGIRLGDRLAAVVPIPPDHDLLVVRVPGVGGFRLARRIEPWEIEGDLPPVDPPTDVWDVVAELAFVGGCEVVYSGISDRRRLVRTIRAYLRDPASAETQPLRHRARRTSRRIPRG